MQSEGAVGMRHLLQQTFVPWQESNASMNLGDLPLCSKLCQQFLHELPLLHLRVDLLAVPELLELEPQISLRSMC